MEPLHTCAHGVVRVISAPSGSRTHRQECAGLSHACASLQPCLMRALPCGPASCARFLAALPHARASLLSSWQIRTACFFQSCGSGASELQVQIRAQTKAARSTPTSCLPLHCVYPYIVFTPTSCLPLHCVYPYIVFTPTLCSPLRCVYPYIMFTPTLFVPLHRVFPLIVFTPTSC